VALEAQAVEHVLQPVREILDRIEAEHAGERLERVRRAEQAVDQLWIGAALAPALVREVGDAGSHRLENLLGLGDEFAIRLGAPPGTGSSRRHGA
jgi:hypothetical protein